MQGLVDLVQGEYATASSLLEEGLALARELGNKTFTPFYLEGLASTVAAQGLLAWAAQLLGAADTLRRTSEIEVTPVLHNTI